MKFRMFTDAITGRTIAVCVDKVLSIKENVDYTAIYCSCDEYDDKKGYMLRVKEDVYTVFSRLNTISE